MKNTEMIKVFNKMIDNIKQVIDDPTNDHMDQETIAVDMLDGIEVFANGKWRTLGILMFDEDLDYRVKPNTKTLGNNLEIPLPLTRGQNLNTLKISVVRSRVSEDVKVASEEILNSLGLSMSDGIRLFLNQLINNRTLPFDLKPNAQTLESFNSAVTVSETVDSFFEDVFNGTATKNPVEDRDNKSL